jgi:hypothetical protein
MAFRTLKDGLKPLVEKAANAAKLPVSKVTMPIIEKPGS